MRPSFGCDAEAPFIPRLSTRSQTKSYMQRKRTSDAFGAFTTFTGAAAEAFSHPTESHCVRCQIRIDETPGGCSPRTCGFITPFSSADVGLCAECHANAEKVCLVCDTFLDVAQLQYGSGVCDSCYDRLDKECCFCQERLDLSQLHWRTGLCDTCYDSSTKDCFVCSDRLEPGQFRWRSGLCDQCYDRAEKTCKMCDCRIDFGEVRYGTGICNSCYDTCEKQCTKCESRIDFGSLHWRTSLCDECYDKTQKTCSACQRRLSICNNADERTTGFCTDCLDSSSPVRRKLTEHEPCQQCKVPIRDSELHWGSGLCDKCYNGCDKACKKCQGRIDLRHLHWGTGLCNDCFDNAMKQCRMCQSNIGYGELRWGSGLCNACYDSAHKSCSSCTKRIDVLELHFGTGMCNECYDKRRALKSNEATPGVWTVILSQFAFYFAPGLLTPTLYLKMQELGGTERASSNYACVLSVAMTVSMVAPVFLGAWAEAHGERQVYFCVVVTASFGALLLSWMQSPLCFAMAWALLVIPPSLRGVRSAFFAKNVPPEELSRASQLSSAFGLLGGFLGPFVASRLEYVRSLFGDEAEGGADELVPLPSSFAMACSVSWLALLACCVAVSLRMPAYKRSLCSRGEAAVFSERCERCNTILEPREKEYAFHLCDSCYDEYGGQNYNFKSFRRNTLVSFCMIGAFLEFSENCGIIASFQPIVVTHFGWSSKDIARVNMAGAGLSVIISFGISQLRLRDRHQLVLAAGLYASSVWIFTLPPLAEWKLILGLMLGIKSQILFMAPFTAIFSRLIGRVRVTNTLTTPLVLAPLVGATLGTMTAPLAAAQAGDLAFSGAACPATLAAMGIAYGWKRLEDPRRVVRPGA